APVRDVERPGAEVDPHHRPGPAVRLVVPAAVIAHLPPSGARVGRVVAPRPGAGRVLVAGEPRLLAAVGRAQVALDAAILDDRPRAVAPGRLPRGIARQVILDVGLLVEGILAEVRQQVDRPVGTERLIGIAVLAGGTVVHDFDGRYPGSVGD